MDALKSWLMEVGLKKLGPAFIKGAFAWLFVYLGAHQGLLSSFGITYTPADHNLDIDLDTLSVWAVTVGSGSLMAFFSAAQHHAGAAIKGQPQDGEHKRADDPPKGDMQ